MNTHFSMFLQLFLLHLSKKKKKKGKSTHTRSTICCQCSIGAFPLILLGWVTQSCFLVSVFSSISSCWCILISHLSAAPVSAAPVLSVKGHSGPPSRVHTFSREINDLSLRVLPLSFFVICQHWRDASLQKVNVHLAGHSGWNRMDAPLELMNSII